MKLFWDTKLTVFNKTFTLDDMNNNNNDNNNNNTTDSESTIKNNEILSNTIKQKQLFLTKKSARNQLASIILKEIDLPAYEEMLLNQENVKKTLQNFRDGVLSGKCLFLFVFVLSSFILVTFHLLVSFTYNSMFSIYYLLFVNFLLFEYLFVIPQRFSNLIDFPFVVINLLSLLLFLFTHLRYFSPLFYLISLFLLSSSFVLISPLLSYPLLFSVSCFPHLTSPLLVVDYSFFRNEWTRRRNEVRRCH